MQDANGELAQRMLQIKREQNINQLQMLVQENGLLGRNREQGPWVNMNDHLFNFPRLDIDYLSVKTLGSYQVKISPGYIQDTTSRNPNHEFIFQTKIEYPGLLRARLYSRFRQEAKHYIFVQYNENVLNDEDPITGTYCTCKVGARTVGLCAHISSVLWYLGHARHEENTKYPKNNLLTVISDAAQREIGEVVV